MTFPINFHWFNVLNPNAIITVAQAEEYIGLGAGADTDRLETLINAASTLVENFTHRQFIPRSVTDTLSGLGNNVLMLDLAPVQALTTVTLAHADNSTTDITSNVKIDNYAGMQIGRAHV